MSKDFNRLVDVVIEREGGYVNHKNDRGGETKYGISKKAFPKEDIKNMTKARAAALYLEHYWLPARCEALPAHLRDIHFDSAINHGVSRALRLLQRAAGVKVDGVIGPVTIAAAQNVTIQAYVRERLRFINDIVTNDPSQKVFHRGWVKRVSQFLK